MLVLAIFTPELRITVCHLMATQAVNPLSRISHLSGSHASLTHAIAYNPIAKELIRLAKKFKYHFTHH